MTNVSSLYVGVDVSKKYLDIYIYPIEKIFKISNSDSDIKQFIKVLSEYPVKKVVCESTGGYEKPLVKLLQNADYDTWIVDPRRIKGFITAKGCKSKTDKIDAQKIAEFASQNFQDYVAIKKTEIDENLQALINRKMDLILFLAAEKTRLNHPSHALSKISIQAFITIFNQEIEMIDLLIDECIQNDIKLQKKIEILESIPGIGKSSAALFVAFIPELGTIDKRKISSLVGVCPLNNDSGSYSGKRFIRGGRNTPRKALYMCALTSIKYYEPLKRFYNLLRNKNKPFKVAIVAVMHKLIMIANVLLAKGELCKA